MAADSVLRTGLIGYIYRWVRNAGVVAFVSSAAMLAYSVERMAGDQHAVATVSRIELICEVFGTGWFNGGFAREVECSDAPGIVAANPQMALAVREIAFLLLSYRSVAGDERTARIRADAFAVAEPRRGDEIDIAYRDTDGAHVRPALSTGRLVRAGGLMLGGLILLLLVLAAHRAAGIRSDVDDEIEQLKRAHAARRRAPSR